MGSDSDFPIMKKAVDVLKEFGVSFLLKRKKRGFCGSDSKS